MLLRTAKFPQADIPFADSPRTLWDQVAEFVEARGLGDGRTRILRAAHELYINNPVFAMDEPSTTPLRVMLFGASPRGQERLRWDKDLKALQKHAGAVYSVEARAAATVEDLGGLQSASPDIFHFAGHGEDGALVFEDRDGGAYPVAASDVAAMLAFGSRLRLVLLNCCHGEVLAEHFEPVADLVVAFRGWIDDACAAYFVERFYAAVADRVELRAAAGQAAWATAIVDEACRSFGEPGRLILRSRG